MDSGVQPQYDLSVLENEPTYIAELFRQYSIGREYCIPCIVTEYDATARKVDVQPLANHTRDNGKEIVDSKRPIVKGVPVETFAHGGFSVSAPLFKGDTGYLVAADRNCTTIINDNSTMLYGDDANAEKNKGAGVPDDCSLTSFANGFFIPCSWARSEQNESESGNLVIKGIGKGADDSKWQRIILSNDGKIIIEVNDRKFTIGPEGIVFEGETERELLIVTDIRYDISSHQIQAKKLPVEKCGNILVNVGEESDWEMVEGGQAVAVEN